MTACITRNSDTESGATTTRTDVSWCDGTSDSYAGTDASTSYIFTTLERLKGT